MTIKTRGTHYSLAGLVEKFRASFDCRREGREAGSIALGQSLRGGKLIIEFQDEPTRGKYQADPGVKVLVDGREAALTGFLTAGQKLKAGVKGFATIEAEYSLPIETR